MSAKILYGKEYADKIKQEVKDYITENNKNVGLAVIIVGSDPASQVYVRNKAKACNEVGITSTTIELPEESTKEAIIAEIHALNNNDNISGILVQLPLPKHLREFEQEILDEISQKKDVDGFLPINVGKLGIGLDCVAPCTPSGVIKMLEMENVDFNGKNAVVIGRSNIVGKPMANMLLKKNCTVTICHSRTQNLKYYTKNADIVVVAVGQPNFLTDDMIKKGAIIVDVGINRVDGKLVGDVNFETVKEKASMITPVPKGVGALTIAMLLHNTMMLDKRK